MAKWIDLRDVSGAKLKLANIEVEGSMKLHIFITNLAYVNPKWAKCEKDLAFRPAPSRRYLVRRVEAGERLLASTFAPVFPNARLVDMDPSSYMLNTGRGKQEKTVEERSAAVDMRGVKRLGRNADGNEVFESLSGRFFVNEKGGRIDESSAQSPHAFLRLTPPGQPTPQGDQLRTALDMVCAGFIRAMDHGEVQHSEDYVAFRDAVFTSGGSEHDEALFPAIDAALLRHVRNQFDVAQDAYGEAVRLYDYLPPYLGRERGLGAMPLPLSVVAQRLLGDTAEKTVIYPNAFDGASFAFLPPSSSVLAYQMDEAVRVVETGLHPGAQWPGRFSPSVGAVADAMFFNSDPVVDAVGDRKDYRDALSALRALKPGARAILVLAADGEDRPGQLSLASAKFLAALGQRHSVDDVFETAPILSRKSGGLRGHRVFSVRAIDPQDSQEQRARIEQWSSAGVPLLTSWNSVKSHVDELITTIALREAQSESVALERAQANETYQRPYIAFSKIGEARTMVPANLQAPAQAFLTQLESTFGSVDDFVSRELGMGKKTMAERFSPEQIDGIAIMIARNLVGRSSILADDTGIGKGRQLAAMAVWANKRGMNVFFITERSTLFSDLARDLRDIGEWDRFRPLVFNSDGEITVEENPGGPLTVLASAEPGESMNRILAENLPLASLMRNIGFLSYSQISGQESLKAQYIKNQLPNSLVIFDEAHVAAGSDSNIATQISEIAALAPHVQFATATWAKTHDNLHIYQRAFPMSVSVGTLAETMRKGGESFSEIFSAMLCAEGALIRREHDLSKLEVEMRIDENRVAQNEAVSDKVADVLGAAAFVAGDMQQVFIRTNSESVARLQGARDVRATSVRAKLFSANFGGGSVIYQVMKGVQGALNADHVADIALESIAKGMKPVIVTDATSESLLDSMVQDHLAQVPVRGDGEIHIRVPTLRDLLRHVIYKRLSTVRIKEVDVQDLEEAGLLQDTEAESASLDAEDEVVAIAAPVASTEPETLDAADAARRDEVDVQEALVEAADFDPDAAIPRAKKRKKTRFIDVPIEDIEDMPPQALEIYRRGLEEIASKIEAVPDVPVSSFDAIAQRLRDAGVSVGEISGRKNQLVRLSDGSGLWRLMPRTNSKKAVKASIRAFNNGGMDVLVMNRVAASGYSMHSSPRFLDRSRRHLIEHQMPENPVTRVQLLGRVNRFDQLSSPLMTSSSTGIYGEVRYLMMQNRKLARMSANVRSSRDNAMSLKGVVDLFNSVGRDAVRGFLHDNPLIMRRLGIREADLEMGVELVNRTTMMLPLLKVAQQRVVYEELYARFDEIMLRAEMEGENPLRPHEFDVRATIQSETVFFGDDAESDELISAFDAPVIARKIKWTETKNPITFNAVLEAAKASVERLRAEGYLLPDDDERGAPQVDPRIVEKVVKGYHSLTRLAHMASEEADYAKAMCTNAPASRAYLKYDWIEDNLPNLAPGSRLGRVALPTEAEQGGELDFTQVVITDVRPPAREEEYLDPGKWKITVVASGDERASSYTLRSVLSGLRGKVVQGEVSGSLMSLRSGPMFAKSLLGARHETVINAFEFATRGQRVRTANVLTGNMYLASEWAAAARKGVSALYTDEAGARHRVIMLPDDMARLDPAYLPVRVAEAGALQKVLGKVEAIRSEEGVVFDTSFKSAMASMSGDAREGVFVYLPGRLIAMSVSGKDARRIRAALASGHRAVVTGEDDPDALTIRMHTARKEINRLPAEVLAAIGSVQLTTSIGGFDLTNRRTSSTTATASLITLTATTTGQLARAVHLLHKHAGLELYATDRDAKELARSSIREVMTERRLAMRELHERVRAHVHTAADGAESELRPDAAETPQDGEDATPNLEHQPAESVS
jgi:hypothetical protein